MPLCNDLQGFSAIFALNVVKSDPWVWHMNGSDCVISRIFRKGAGANGCEHLYYIAAHEQDNQSEVIKAFNSTSRFDHIYSS